MIFPAVPRKLRLSRPFPGLSRPARVSGGFTLLEIVLVAALLLLLAGLTVVTFAGFGRSKNLDEGAWQFETALRMARAESANLGRKIRLECDLQSGQFKVTCETDPLAGPGVFTDYSSAIWANNLPTGLVSVSQCLLTEGNASWASTPSTGGTGSSEKSPPAAVTFYPNGSSDSAVFELRSQSEGDERTAVLELDGVNGTISAQILQPSEYQERQEQQASGS
jgi:type II secretory pathway pseudopilin PulG